MLHSSIAPREMSGQMDAAPVTQLIALVSGVYKVCVKTINFSKRARLRTKLVYNAISEIIYMNGAIYGVYKLQ